MGYFDQTIKDVLTEIENGKLFLPAIQRKFVWNEEQITKLFDSLMRGYPIGTFLFWDIDKEKDNIKDYVFYDFIRDYHERDLFCQKNYSLFDIKQLTNKQLNSILYIP
jgi:uncharacterized protein with ParB-like and HNH nuclease domain